MNRPAIIHACLGSLIVAAAVYGCQAPAETFHLSGDASLESLSSTGGTTTPGTGGETPGTGGIIAATGGMVSTGGVVGTGGVVATGGVGVGGGGRGGSTTGGRGGSSSGGSGGVAGSSTGGRGGSSTGGRGGSTTGGRGGTTTGGAGGGDDEKVLSIDFGVGGMGATAMSSTEVAGAKAARRWNSAVGASGTLSTTLVFADGSAATGTMVTWSSPSAPSPNTGIYVVGLTDTTGDGHMMNGYLDPGMSPGYEATVTVSGLRAPLTTSGYDVYVYFMAELPTGVTRSHELSIGTKSFTVSQTGKSPTVFSKHTKAVDKGTTGDYVVFTNVTGASFTLSSDSVSASDSIMRAPVNGIQIVWPTGS